MCTILIKREREREEMEGRKDGKKKNRSDLCEDLESPASSLSLADHNELRRAQRAP